MQEFLCSFPTCGFKSASEKIHREHLRNYHLCRLCVAYFDKVKEHTCKKHKEMPSPNEKDKNASIIQSN